VRFLFYFSVFTLGALACPAIAHAYIDPGIGSLMLQGLAAAGISALLFWRMILQKIRSFFSGHNKREHGDARENRE
jgi:hypothetical protein